MPEIDKKWVFVTGFFNITKHSNKSYNIDDYIKWSEFVLSLPVQLVIYCEEDLVDTFRQIRRKHVPDEHTQFVIKAFADLPYYRYLEKVRQNRLTVKPCFDPRNSPEYFTIICSKFTLLNDTIDQNYFGQEDNFYAWIDFGLVKNSGPDYDSIKAITNVYRRKCSFCYINYTAEHIMNDYDKYYSRIRWGTACGFFTADRTHMKQLCIFFDEEAVKTIELGYGHGEEQVIAVIYHEHPELFEFYYGDYNELLCNYVYPIRNIQNILFNFVNNTRECSKNDLCYLACEKVWQSYITGRCDLLLEQVVKLTEEFFICAFYMHKFEESMKFYNDMSSRWLEPPLEQPIENCNLEHLISNTDYYWPYVRSKYNKFALLSVHDELEVKSLVDQGYKVLIQTNTVNYASLCFANPVIRSRRLMGKLREGVNFDIKVDIDIDNRRYVNTTTNEKISVDNDEPNVKYLLKIGDEIDDKVYNTGCWDLDIIRSITHYIKRDSNVIDVGANIGVWSVEMARIMNGNVYSFEPQRLIFQQLCANIFLNGLKNVYTYNFALSNKKGRCKMSCPDKHNLGATALKSEEDEIRNRYMNTDVNYTEEVKLKILDDLDIENVSFMKIDVEGHELYVLQGAQNLIAKCKPVILFECWMYEWFTPNRDILFKFVENTLNYKITKYFNGDNVLAVPQ